MSGTEIFVNGELRSQVPPTVTELLKSEGLDPARRGLAVAINGTVVRRGAWGTTRLNHADQVEIVKPFSGG